MKHHLEAETLLRYVILIACLIIINILFYSYFDFGRESIHAGILVWIVYGLWHKFKPNRHAKTS